MNSRISSLLFNFYIFAALMSRNMRIMCRNIPGLLLDCLSPALAQVLIFGYVLPLIGLPSAMIGPAYLGSIMSLFFQLGYSITMQMGFDIESTRFIDYQLTLPIKKSWLFATFIITNMLETAAAMVPIIMLGMILLPGHFAATQINWLALILLFPLILLFFSLFFLIIAFRYNFWWIRTNFWPRRMLPLFFVSPGLVAWQDVFAWWPALGYFMLLNPLTYISEGLRATILGTAHYINPWYCIIVLTFYIIIFCQLLRTSVDKKLNPV